jgi:membrane-bound lytic murein transglycosylase D
LGIGLVALPLFGCAAAIDSPGDPAGMSITGQAPSPSPVSSPAEVENPVTPDRLPFVRSQPEAVAPFPLTLNRTVQAYVDEYVNQPSVLTQSFKRIGPYMPEMSSMLRDEGLPPELLYLTVAESGFSNTGAGPWQLSRETARRFGLTINRWIDERRDPIKSTRAAAAYLAMLRDQTGPDWRMTLVAWNNGEAGVDRYLQLRDASYESLLTRLPPRTSALLNRFMAVALIARHREAYGIEPAHYAPTAPYEVVPVKGGTPLKTVAARHHTQLEVLRRLNPALIRNCVPPCTSVYTVRVPASEGTASPLAPADL